MRTRRAIWLLALAVACAATGAAADDLGERAARVAAERPGLLRLSPSRDGVRVAGVDEAAFAALLADLVKSGFGAKQAEALDVVITGLAAEQGALAGYGGTLLAEAVGVTSESGNPKVLRGIAAWLLRIANDGAHPYGLQAEELLGTKLRCGAVSVGDTRLLAEIAARIEGDARGSLAQTDGDVADRWGLHARARLLAVEARGQRVVAAGDFGTLAISDDGGQSFETPTTGTDEPLYAVALGPGTEVWAAGRVGAVLHSPDGRRFQRRDPPLSRHLFGAAALGPGRALFTGDFGLQLVAQAGGERWTCLPRDADVILGRIVPAGRDRALVGEFGTIERFGEQGPPGRRAVLQGVPEEVPLFDLWFDAPGRVAIAVGLAGTILRSEDGGARFAPVASPAAADLYGVGGAGDLVVAVGEGGEVVVSRDRGRSFERTRPEIPPLPLHDVGFADAEHGYAVGALGLILATDDGGRSWRVARGGLP